MFPRRIILTAIAVSAVPLALGCGNHDEHGGTGTLGAPVKGGLGVQGTALFVALGKTGEVAVIDVANWRLAGKVKVADKFYPHHLGLSPDRTRVALGAPGNDLSAGHGDHSAGARSGAIFIIDSRTGDVLAQKTVAGTAHNLAFLPDGNAVVYALAEHGMLHIANASTLADTGSVPVGASPLEATPTGAGGVVLVSNSGAGTITAVDTTTKQVTKSIAVGMNPIAAWLGVGGRALVTSEADRKLSVLDLTSLSMAATATLDGVPGQAAHTMDGKQIWVALEDKGKVAILDAADLKPAGEVVVAQRPHGLALSTTGSSFFLTDENGGKVFELDIARREVLRSLDVGGAPNGILLRPAL